MKLEDKGSGAMKTFTCSLLGGKNPTDNYTDDAFKVATLLMNHAGRRGETCRCCNHGLASSRTGCRSNPVIEMVKAVLTFGPDDDDDTKKRKLRLELIFRKEGYPIGKVNENEELKSPPRSMKQKPAGISP
ncbi:MAG: hypothetical protein KKE20_05525 [Nanoarchaeota archaeon]|nr:hypothetical protein [Nanoarchaeota archaeon]